MRSLVLVLAGLLVSTTASANGRAPGTSNIHFQQGNDLNIVAGMTFGVVRSRDGGATWTWECEDAVGYGGTYDPDYAYTSTGAMFATTFDGLKVNRDGCNYEFSTLIETDGECFDDDDPDTDPDDCNAGFSCPTKGLGNICHEGRFFSTTTVGPDGTVYAAAADPTNNRIYRSTDDGMTFPVQPAVGQLRDWWQSLEVAPSNPQVVYLFGYRLENNMKIFLLFKSVDAGVSYQPLGGNEETGNEADGTPGVNGLLVMPNSIIEIAGISKTDPNVIYARVTLSDNSISDAIYRSRDGGGSWEKILEKAGSLAFAVRSSGELVAGTQAVGSFRGMDAGSGVAGTAVAATFTELVGAPHINCLAVNSADVVFACTQNYGSPTVEKDDFGIMTSTDLVTWTGSLKFQNITVPTACDSGSIQRDRCDALLWCGLCAQLGCDAKRECAVFGDGPPPDGLIVDVPKKGCCQGGSDDLPGLLIIGIAASIVVLRRKTGSTDV